MNLAAATQSDLARTAEITTATLSQFGLEADDAGRVADVFTASVAGSQASLKKLGDAMRFVGPVAEALGESLENTTAAISLLFNAGFKGEQAGTIMRAAFLALQKPTSQQATLLQELSVTVNDAAGEFVGFRSIIEQLEKKQISLNEAATLFGTEAAPGMIALIKQGTTAFDEMRVKLDATNKAMEVAALQTDTLTGDWKLFKSALEETALILFDQMRPALRSLVQSLTEVATAMAETSKRTAVIQREIELLQMRLDRTGVPLFFQELLGGTERARVKVALLRGELFDLIEQSQAFTVADIATVAPAGAGGGADGDPEGDSQALLRERARERLELEIETERERQEILREIRTEGLDADFLIFEEHGIRMAEQEADTQRRIFDIMRIGLTAREKFERQSTARRIKTVADILQSGTEVAARTNKTMFQINKVAAIANAVINTAVAVSNALAIPPPPVGLALAAIMAAAGAAEISAIKSAQFGGGGAVGTFNVSPATGIPTGAGVSEVAPLFDEEVAPSTTVNITIEGTPTSQQVIDLIDEINEAVGDGVTLVATPA